MSGNQKGMGEAVCIERRRHERRACDRPCKVLHAPSMRYLPARTRDLAPAGALIELSGARRVGVGDRIDLLVDWTQRGLIHSGSTIRATVVRVADAPGETQRIGVAFASEIAAQAA